MPPGYSLVEVVVALLILEVGLLGAAGLVVTSARHVGAAARMQRQVALAEAVADSLVTWGWGGEGSRMAPPFTVEWSGAGGWALVEVRGPDGGRPVRIPVPVVEP